MNNETISDALEPVAIIGLSGRFPGARNVDEFWENLRRGVESISFFSNEELAAHGVDSASLADPGYVRAKGAVRDIDLFDAAFFGIGPKEALIMDPQHRLFLECAWEAVENAGLNPELFEGRVGVFAGVGLNSYLLRNLMSNPELLRAEGVLPVAIGNDKDFLPSRVSYKLNLKGPSININTACSTSLVAIQLACQSLLNYQCDAALAGAAAITVPEKEGYHFQEGGILSPNGQCRAFDARAQGTVGGSGVGVVVLKRLADALAEGDFIHAVIRGCAVNNDGAGKVGYTAPSVEGQAAVIAEAQSLAGVDPETITYVEAHGTGTKLGDPIEIAALTQAFRLRTQRKNFCAIGSVKSNIGHLDTAAGMAGLIKTILALRHREIPPSLRFETPNPEIDFSNSPFFVNDRLREWRSNGVPRRAGISSFGIGGTNAHVILEEAPAALPSGKSRPEALLIVSAKSESALNSATSHLAAHFNKHPEISLADAAFTLQTGRRGFNRRRFLVCRNRAEAEQALDSLDATKVTTGVAASEHRPVVFLFPGQGSQHVNMGRALYETERVFRGWIDRCSELLKPSLGVDLRGIIYPSPGSDAAAGHQLSQTHFTQAALFAMEYALAKWWEACGIKPEAMIGHSIGEYVAACLAGVFSLEEALDLVSIRGRLMQQVAPGGMMAVSLSMEELQPWLDDNLAVAAVNGPASCVVSGPSEVVAELEKKMAARKVAVRRLHTSHAFHSAMMEPILESFALKVGTVRLQPPRIPYVSNVTGDWITDEEATDASYWSRHLRQTVRFSDGIERLLRESNRILLEVGPGRVLSTLAIRHPAKQAEQMILTSCSHPQEKSSDSAFLLTTLGKLWMAGAPVDWKGFSAGEERQRLPLPTYPFERERFWVEPRLQHPVGTTARLVRKADVSDWFYVPSWKRSVQLVAQTGSSVLPACALVFLDSSGFGKGLIGSLARRGVEIVAVTIGLEFSQEGPNAYTINPRQSGEYERLLSSLQSRNKRPEWIIHLWCLEPRGVADLPWEALEQAQERGFFSLIFLTQALAQHNSAKPVQILVVSNSLHEVTGEEVLAIENTPVLGAVKVIPQEYPHIQCRNIDLAFTAVEAANHKLVEFVLAEAGSGSTDQIVAYRGSHRWLRIFEPIRWDEASLSAARPTQVLPGLRKRGVYLITGGLGGLGMVLAEHLSKHYQARLVLIGRSDFPARSEWDSVLACENCSQESAPARKTANQKTGYDWASAAPGLARKEQELITGSGIKEIQDNEGLIDTFNELSAVHICEYFTSQQVNIARNQSYDKEELRSRLGILPKFKKFFDFFIQVLAEDSILEASANQITFLKDQAQLSKSQQLTQEAVQKFPGFRSTLEFLEHCVRHYPAALTGQIEAISVLYPDGRGSLMKEAAQKTVEHTLHTVYHRLLREIVHQLVDSSSKTIRILEIGGGNGFLTNVIAPGLRGKNVEYHFTDIGKSFVVNVEKQSAALGGSFMRFGLLDISQDPRAQGYSHQSFDVIFGLDVVHATKRVTDTVQNLKQLLRPGGLLCLIETSKTYRWNEMIWGLAEGWWYFEDVERRNRGTPLMNLGQWSRLMEEQGFASTRIFPMEKEKQAGANCGLIVAQLGTEEKAENAESGSVTDNGKQNDGGNIIRRLKRMEQHGAEIDVSSADVTELTQMRAVLAKAEERFGRINGVIHAAASLAGGAIQWQTLESGYRELLPKMKGAWVLEELFKGADLDFMAFCSSVTSATGGIGNSAYSAANAFLDAFAVRAASREPGGSDLPVDLAARQHIPTGVMGREKLRMEQRTSQGRRHTVSIDWDRWQSVGQAIPVEQRHAKRTNEELAGGITPEEGVAAFQRILASPSLPLVIVSPRDFNAVIETVEAIEIPERATSSTLHHRPALQSAYVSPGSETEKILAGIWQEVLGIQQVGVRDNFYELGGDSLIAIQVLSRLRKICQVQLTVRQLFEQPTIAEQAERIATIQWAAQKDWDTKDASVQDRDSVEEGAL
jgi:acyl transferase domain-containing protein/2-polyprenyl-3-methyl-5-hydroxy-6-metoxy-1,4-benzoquinol methylase/aryl carrier-like protein